MIGRYTMGALEARLRLDEVEADRALRRGGGLPARHDFEDLEFLAGLDKRRDRDRRVAAHHDNAVGADALRAQDVLDRCARARKLDLRCRLVKPAANSDFGRNPSAAWGRANA